MFFWDPTMILLIPAILLAAYAQIKVKSTYAKFKGVVSSRGITGYQMAKEILTRNGINNIEIEKIDGELTDHYDPRKKVLRLSNENFRGGSMAALGVAAHEVGHALQHKDGYVPLTIRNSIVPVVSFGSTMAFPLLLIGIFMSISSLIEIGIVLFAGVVLFHIITLPVEFNASSRAIVELRRSGYFQDDEIAVSRKVLNAAAMTYIAATAVAALNLIRMILIRNAMDD